MFVHTAASRINRKMATCCDDSRAATLSVLQQQSTMANSLFAFEYNILTRVTKLKLSDILLVTNKKTNIEI